MGPLSGIKIVEIAAMGPGPFATMLLSDMGANVIRVQRPGHRGLFGDGGVDVVGRGRTTVTADLKEPEGQALVLGLADRADALIEGFRPGVMERLGLGPKELIGRNERLVYGRMTGFGQEGPLAKAAGHDINYISMAGALGSIARQGERPLFPLNLLGDYGGGAMFLALGIVSALLEARTSGQGQVVDAAMVDGTSLLMSVFHGMRASGVWQDEPGTNVLDSGAHFYEVYTTADGGYISVGAIEPQFYAELLRVLGLENADFPQWDRVRWPEFKARFREAFQSRTRAEWAQRLAGTEACATPVLTLAEVASHPHNVAREAFRDYHGVSVPAPAPRFSRTPSEFVDRDPRESLVSWGIEELPGIELPAVERILSTVPGGDREA